MQVTNGVMNMADPCVEVPTVELASLAISSSPPALSPPTSPIRPKRSPLRTPSSPSVNDVNGTSTARESLMTKIRGLSREVTRSLDHVYQIEELRHSQNSNSSAQLDELLSNLDSALDDIPPQLSSIQDEANSLGVEAEGTGSLEELHANLEDLVKQHSLLKEEMKEDGWLSRFRITADQAEAMMVPLEKSVKECMAYVDRITSSANVFPLDSELNDVPNIHTLTNMARRHEAMKGTYVPSVSKILKMMDKSINDRATKNGEALRRYGDMTSRWTELHRQLQRLDVRIRLILSQHSSPSAMSPGEIEVMTDETPSHASSPTDYFGSFKDKMPPSHRSSFSSTTSRLSAASKVAPRASQSPSTLSPPTAQHTLHHKTSFRSSTSSSTAKMVEKSPVMTTPTNRRITSFGSRYGSVSPTPTQGSAASSIASRSSRIPVLSPKSFGRLPIPSLSVSTSTTHTPLDMEMLKTPEPIRRPSGNSMTVPRVSLTPHSRAFSTGTAPRMSLGRNPPSSFRSNTPTPARPSSRLSMVSYAASAVAPANLQPFQPSKFDLLDATVQSIIDETGFNLFTARVDAPMKRGQRRRDDEEWKGEFVFGAGQKTSSVKLLKLAGRTGKDELPRMKCLVRVGGAWQDLAGVLRKRLSEA